MSTPIGLQVTPIFEKNFNAITGVERMRNGKRYKIIVNRGGTRSSKTHSILQSWEYLCSKKKNLKILICRKELPDLKNSALKDFSDYIEGTDRYSGLKLRAEEDEEGNVINEVAGYDGKAVKAISKFWNLHKTDLIYTHKETGSEIHFKAYKDPQKVKGVKYDYIQLTEGDELPYDVFRQLILRVKKCIVIDFNPSNESTWINKKIEQGRSDFKLIKSSYRDNPFLDSGNIEEIEDLMRTDPDYFHIFGNGEYGTVQGRIFDYKTISFEEFKALEGCFEFLGLDFGWSTESCLMHVKFDFEGNCYAHEVFNQKRLKPEEMHEIMLEYGLIDPHFEIYCDPNRPSIIEDLFDLGWNCFKAKKDVKDGISFVKKYSLYLTRESTKSKNQFDTYKFKTNANGESLDEPVKYNDHSPDSVRYAIYSALNSMFR